MKIVHVDKGSPADALGLQPGDDLLEINGHPLRDEIDFQFYSVDEPIRLVASRNGQVLTKTLRQMWEGGFGAHFAGMKYRHCGNRCLFCFIDQNPSGLRRGLYFKDEDFRLSFLYGNYVTLTNATQRDLQRIVEQRLSPLYISVHAVDTQVRQRLLGLRRDDRLLSKIRFLADHGILLHAQIVLCPGYNDGPVLEDTLHRLLEYHPSLQSVAVVPVGLTRHRRHLTPIAPVSRTTANQILQLIETLAHRLQQTLGTYWVYAADELYLRAGHDLPGKRRYDQFPQIENGVGMCRDFIDTINRQKRYYPRDIPRTRITLVTGRSAGPLVKKYLLPTLQDVVGLSVNQEVITNHFFGRRVTVTGLLTGQDIARQLRGKRLGDLLVLPSNCLNPDGRFLDEWTLAQLEQTLTTRIVQAAKPLDIFHAL